MDMLQQSYYDNGSLLRRQPKAPYSTAVVLMLAPRCIELLQCLSNCQNSMRIGRCCWSVGLED